MKKKIFSLLLVVSLVAALAIPAFVINANAAEYNPYHCICGAKQYADANATTPSSTNGTCKCDGVNHTWTAWDGKTGTITESGYYYLAEDKTISAGITLGSESMTADVVFCLDLAGNTLSSSKRVFTLLGDGADKAYAITLNISDSVGGGELKTTSTASGAVIWDDYRVRAKEKTVNIYGGKLASVGTTDAKGTGTALCGYCTETSFNIYAGEITGSITHGSDGKSGKGGTVYLTSATMNLYGGTIHGGTAEFGAGIFVNDKNGKVTMNGGVVKGGTGNQGGAVYMRTGTFTMNGGTIYAGTTTENSSAVWTQGTFTMNGGTIDASGKTAKYGIAITTWANGDKTMVGNVTINDGLILGGTATNNGGGAFFIYADTTVTMNGGTIMGGEAKGTGANQGGGNVHNNGTFIMNGGVVTGGKASGNNQGGGVFVRAGKTFKVSGNAQVTGNTGSNVYLLDGDKIAIGESGLGSKAKIGVSMKTPGVFTAANTSAYAANFTADDGKYFVITNADKALELTDKLDGFVAMVGSTPYATVEDALAAITDSKTQSIKLIANVTQAVEIKKDVYLDLNGRDMDTVTVADGATLYVFDSQTADYAVNTTNRDYGVIKTVNGKVARTFLNADNYRYLVVKTNDGYSAHRIYMAVTSSIIDGTKNGGMKYSTVLKCDEVVAGLIADYGVTVSNGTTSQNVSNFGTGETCTINAWGGSNMNEKVSGVYEILKSGDAGNAAASEIAFGASAYITLNDSFGDEYKTVNSAVKERSMKEMIVTAVQNWGSLTAEQQATLKAIYNAFNNGAYMDDKNKWPNVADKLK